MRTLPPVVPRLTRRRLLGHMAGGLGLASLPPVARAENVGKQPSDVRAIEVTARPIKSFERSSSSKTQFGPLEFRGGLVLSSSAEAFGGWSGIVVEPDGRRFLSISDEGSWMSGEIRYAEGAPAGLDKVRIGPLRGVGGRPLDKKRDLDAEAITFLDGNLAKGTVLIGFERNHRIGRFPVIDGVLQDPIGYVKLPPEARRMSANKSFEAVAVMKGGPFKGSVIAFSENLPDANGHHTGWLWVKGEPQRLAVTMIGGFELTDAVSLDDGTLLLLERRFKWTEGVKMRIRRFAPPSVRPAGVLDGETLIEADMSFEIDNMEGLAAHKNARGETILTLMSDDNFNHFLQRTILLQFALADPKSSDVKTAR